MVTGSCCAREQVEAQVLAGRAARAPRARTAAAAWPPPRSRTARARRRRRPRAACGCARSSRTARPGAGASQLQRGDLRVRAARRGRRSASSSRPAGSNASAVPQCRHSEFSKNTRRPQVGQEKERTKTLQPRRTRVLSRHRRPRHPPAHAPPRTRRVASNSRIRELDATRPDVRVARLASDQWGVVDLDELRACGLDEGRRGSPGTRGPPAPPLQAGVRRGPHQPPAAGPHPRGRQGLRARRLREPVRLRRALQADRRARGPPSRRARPRRHDAPPRRDPDPPHDAAGPAGRHAHPGHPGHDAGAHAGRSRRRPDLRAVAPRHARGPGPAPRRAAATRRDAGPAAARAAARRTSPGSSRPARRRPAASSRTSCST